MIFTAEEYYEAATERIRQASETHEAGKRYALAMYCSGLAVECMLRAIRWQKDSSFEGRHDLSELFRASGFHEIHEGRAWKKRRSEEEITRSATGIREAMIVVSTLGNNNLRYASEASLRAYLRRNGRLRGIRGDALKKNSSDLLNAAQVLVREGTELWNWRRR